MPSERLFGEAGELDISQTQAKQCRHVSLLKQDRLVVISNRCGRYIEILSINSIIVSYHIKSV